YDVSGLDPESALDFAAQVGVTRVVQASDDAAEAQWAERFAATHSSVIACVALHPNEVARHPERMAEGLDVIERLAGAGGHVRAIGETGLDYFRSTEPDQIARQQESFRAHIQLAKAHGLALVIHDRDAHDDCARILDDEGWPERTIFHCFSGDVAFARRCLDHGAFLSFPGTVTYKANHHLREAAVLTPADRLLVETDAPYLTPVPARGRSNASYLIPHTVRYLAQLRDVDLDVLCHTLNSTADIAFGGSW
ncbi:MAG: TatD family hydrolase, partial [Propionibacteriaceae bacterium]